MSAYAKATHALGICDKCGVRCKHSELKEERENGSLRGFLVCPSCWDPDHPQNFINRVDITDPQTIRNARPDTGLDSSRSLAGWSPLTGEEINIYIGTITFGNA